MDTFLMLAALAGVAGWLCWEISRAVDGFADRIERVRGMAFEAETARLLAGMRPYPTSPAAIARGNGHRENVVLVFENRRRAA